MADIPLRDKPFLAHWAPGAILTVAALFYFRDESGSRVFRTLSSYLGSTTLLVLGIALLSFGVGQVLDAIRDGVFEDLLDGIAACLPAGARITRALNWLGVSAINWDFFLSGSERELENLDVWFYSHYMLSFDLSLGTILLAAVPWSAIVPDLQPGLSLAPRVFIIVAGTMLLYDALRLRSHVARLTQRK